jgi:hypothetical protein
VVAAWLVAFAQRQRSARQRRTAKATAGQDQQVRPDEKAPPPVRPAADVQAAITVLGRRELPPDGLRRLDLSRVELRGVDLDHANLQGASLDSANLQEASLYGANLQHAFLHGANLQLAFLYGANLQDADLEGAKNLQDAVLVGAQADETTRWPDGWTPEMAKDRGVQYPD